VDGEHHRPAERRRDVVRLVIERKASVPLARESGGAEGLREEYDAGSLLATDRAARINCVARRWR